jgi:hypothetical protein
MWVLARRLELVATMKCGEARAVSSHLTSLVSALPFTSIACWTCGPFSKAVACCMSLGLY